MLLIDRRVVVQGVLVASVVFVLLQLLRLMAIRGSLLQLLDYVSQVFINHAVRLLPAGVSNRAKPAHIRADAAGNRESGSA